MFEKPDWNRGDTVKSIIEVAAIGRAALAECINDAADWLDTKLADRINTKEDEL
jgi:hypothetical protein